MFSEGGCRLKLQESIVNVNQGSSEPARWCYLLPRQSAPRDERTEIPDTPPHLKGNSRTRRVTVGIGPSQAGWPHLVYGADSDDRDMTKYL